MKTVVSVSLGSSQRDKVASVRAMNETFELKRIGTNGNLRKFAETFVELDGHVSALGVGGADLYVYANGRRYAFPQVQRLVAGARKTPVVDGSGLKNTLEYDLIRRLESDGTVPFSRLKTLLVSGVDRYGMAKALHDSGASTTFGDLMFGLGIPIPIRRFDTLNRLARVLLPVVTRIPIQWLYPTGKKQEANTPKFEPEFQRADVIAGDWHFIRRYAPASLKGKIVVTQSLRATDYELLKSKGVTLAITSTPGLESANQLGQESFGTNVMEGMIVSMLGKPALEISESEFRWAISELGWQPSVRVLRP